MPCLRCPACDETSEREDWKDGPGMFRITCPRCSRDFDVGEPEYRLYEPDDD